MEKILGKRVVQVKLFPKVRRKAGKWLEAFRKYPTSMAKLIGRDYSATKHIIEWLVLQNPEKMITVKQIQDYIRG